MTGIAAERRACGVEAVGHMCPARQSADSCVDAIHRIVIRMHDRMHDRMHGRCEPERPSDSSTRATLAASPEAAGAPPGEALRSPGRCCSSLLALRSTPPRRLRRDPGIAREATTGSARQFVTADETFVTKAAETWPRRRAERAHDGVRLPDPRWGDSRSSVPAVLADVRWIGRRISRRIVRSDAHPTHGSHARIGRSASGTSMTYRFRPACKLLGAIPVIWESTMAWLCESSIAPGPRLRISSRSARQSTPRPAAATYPLAVGLSRSINHGRPVQRGVGPDAAIRPPV